MNDTDRPESTVRSKVIGSLLLGLGAGAFVVTPIAPYEADRFQQRSPAPVPGGVLISDEAIARNAIVKAAK